MIVTCGRVRYLRIVQTDRPCRIRDLIESNRPKGILRQHAHTQTTSSRRHGGRRLLVMEPATALELTTPYRLMNDLTLEHSTISREKIPDGTVIGPDGSVRSKAPRLRVRRCTRSPQANPDVNALQVCVLRILPSAWDAAGEGDRVREIPRRLQGCV